MKNKIIALSLSLLTLFSSAAYASNSGNVNLSAKIKPMLTFSINNANVVFDNIDPSTFEQEVLTATSYTVKSNKNYRVSVSSTAFTSATAASQIAPENLLVRVNGDNYTSLTSTGSSIIADNQAKSGNTTKSIDMKLKVPADTETADDYKATMTISVTQL